MEVEVEESIPASAKYIMVGTMFLITIGVLAYMAKKAFDARKAFLKEEEVKAKEGYAKLTILEEQEDQITEKEEEYDMTSEFRTCSVYDNIIADDLWDSFHLHSSLETFHEQLQGAILQASMYYQTFAKYLKIHLISLKNLAAYQISGRTSIKLKVMVCNNMSGRKLSETSKALVLHNNIDINEKMLFKMKEEEVQSSTLYISMFCQDLFYHEFLLGAMSLDLAIADYRVKQIINEEIIPVKKDRNIYGYLLVSLCHVPCVERLVCVVLCGREFQVDVRNTSILDNIINPYVQLSLLNNGKLTKSFKTKVLLETNNPSINEMFEFYISEAQLPSADILLMVMHKDSNHSHQTIGKVVIGNHANGDLYEHWNAAITNPEITIARWHPIMKVYP